MTENNDIKDLQESIQSLEKTIQKSNKKRWIISKGILTGLGGTLGATVIFAIVTAVISGTLYYFGIFPDVREYFGNI